MNMAKRVGMRFNPNKCQFKLKQVKFFGLILTHEGIVPDPSKIMALKSLPEPKMKNFCSHSLVWSITSPVLTQM